MASHDNIGDQIRDAVQDAVSKQDFSDLVNVVERSINYAGDRVREGIARASAAAEKSRQEAEKNQAEAEEKRIMSMRGKEQRAIKKSRFAGSGSRLLSDTLLIILGMGMALTGAGFLVLYLIGELSFAFVGTLQMALYSTSLAGGATLFGFGTVGLSFTDRFKKYCTIIGMRSSCTVRQLSEMTGRSEKRVLKDLRKMIKKGLFRQGHITEDSKTLIVSDREFTRYLADKAAEEERKKREALIASVEEPEDDVAAPTYEEREILQRGEAYVLKIRAINKEIPGEKITAQIDQIVFVTAKILARAKEHPEVMPDLRKLMDYYLPITVRLLEAYRDLDGQPIQGDNIISSKHEIESTLEILNDALEKLLDSIFRDAAWDVSTDARILQTMLAQEGLVGDFFAKPKDSGEGN